MSSIRTPHLALHEPTRRGHDDRIDGYNVGSNGPEAGLRLDTIFPAIADYAFLSDCENNCLISPTGAVEWLCLPHPHDPSVFGTILDRSAGSFRLGPTDTAVPASRRYLPGTNILESTWQTRTGWLVVQDFLAVGPWHRTTDRSSLHRRTPGDFDAQHVLVRYATCLYGAVDITLDCEPAFDYGRTDANVSALVEIGETARARQLCERLLGFATGLGLYAEQLDPTTSRHFGNFPQALTHLALVNAALHVISAEQAPAGGPSRRGQSARAPAAWWDSTRPGG